jgi:hypothetical protein
LVALVGSQSGEEAGLELGHRQLGVAEPRLAAIGDLNDVTATVARVAPPLGEARALELVEEGDELAWVEVERLGQVLLADRPERAQLHQRECLRTVEPGRLERIREAPFRHPPEMCEQQARVRVHGLLDRGSQRHRSNCSPFANH